MTFKGIDTELLTRKIREADKLLIIMNDDYIEGMKNPDEVDHVALNLQIQEAARGEKEVYLYCIRPLERENFNLVMEMLEGSKLKCIVFIDQENKEDMEMANRILHLAMGRVKFIGKSGDAWKDE